MTQSNNIDDRLELALVKQKLATASEEDLKNCLRYVFALIGIRGKNLPVDEEKEFLHSYIRQHYGIHSADEVRLAFDMAIQGKLSVDATCYENFSVEYFARIMNAFRRWAGRQELALQTKNDPSKLYTPAQLVDINIEYAFYLFSLINKLPCKWPKVNLRTR